MNHRFSSVFPAWELFEHLAGGSSWKPGHGAPLRRRYAAESLSWSDDSRGVISVDLPGTTVDDVNLSVEGDTLTVSVKQESASTAGTDSAEPPRWVRRERPRITDWEQNYQLPFTVDLATVEAELNNGVLTVRLNRTELEKPQQIAITAGT